MDKNPRHIGIILDGNRRFARRLMMKPWMGHEWGAKKLQKLFEWCKELGVKELTLYCFSLENFRRPKKEFDYLMELFRKEFRKLIKDPRLKSYDVKINFLGRINLFPKDIQEEMKLLMNKTRHHKKYVINFAMAYGGRQEIADAARRIADDLEKGKISAAQIDEKLFAKYLYMSDEPDLVIRTGGEQRLSNFLLYHCAYAELIFLQKFWPEFEKKDLIACVKEYKKRKRRFGR
jgi:tritrans,polycis-undecaprenyl-diphosphate synthase [geranylgeranyl-diphosphate specific]